VAIATLVATVLGLATRVEATAFTPPPRRPPPPIPRTVDHPLADSVLAFDNGSRDAPLIALTFDADMSPDMLYRLRTGQVASWYNRDVVDVLHSENVPATMFLTGLWAETYTTEARQLATDPLFEVGSHTFDHAAFRSPCWGLPSARDRASELVLAQEAIASATGLTPNLLRFPGDCWTYADVALAQSVGLTTVAGDVRAGDAFNYSVAAIVRTVLSAIRPGSIVVMHLQGGPNAPLTAIALRELIPAIRARGLGFARVSDLLGLPHAGVPAPNPPVGLTRARRPRGMRSF
jgi:peptidoglycan/xylan/chitin deacetylase (PgdA/CDA1 family)